jgi:hypothetical protein
MTYMIFFLEVCFFFQKQNPNEITDKQTATTGIATAMAIVVVFVFFPETNLLKEFQCLDTT